MIIIIFGLRQKNVCVSVLVLVIIILSISECLDYLDLESQNPFRCGYVYSVYDTYYNSTRNCNVIKSDESKPDESKPDEPPSSTGAIGGVPSHRDQFRHMVRTQVVYLNITLEASCCVDDISNTWL